MKPVFRVRPSLFFRFELQQRFLWIFWEGVSYSDRYEDLASAVDRIGGRIVE